MRGRGAEAILAGGDRIARAAGGDPVELTRMASLRLLADGWHRVKSRSFGIEPYGYVAGAQEETATADEKGNGNGKGKGEKNGKSAKKKDVVTPAHVAEKGLTPIMGARWTKPNGEVIACPVGSVLALRQARRRVGKA